MPIPNTACPPPSPMAVGQKRKRSADEVKPLDDGGGGLAPAPTSSSRGNLSSRRPVKVPRASLDASRDLLAAGPVPGLDKMGPQLQRIAASGRTAFEKRVLALLCQIPAGRVSTYGLMAAHLGSAPRAVGNAVSPPRPFPPPSSPPLTFLVARRGKHGLN